MTSSNMDIWPIVRAMNKNLPEAEKSQLLSQLHSMIDNLNQPKCSEQIPNWRGEFTNENIDCLLKQEVKGEKMKVIDFLIINKYVDEPELDEDRKPILRRSTAVHLAAELKRMIQLDRLFEIYNNFHVNYENDTGLTHFHAACMSGNYDVVKQFLNSGQDPNGLPQGQVYRDPPLTYAVRHKRINVVELLLEYGADPNLSYKGGLRPLHFICQEFDYDEDTLERFFKMCELRGKPVNVNAQTDIILSTPLLEALRYDNNEMARFLIKRGANINLADLIQNSPLHYLCERKIQDVELLKLILDQPGVDVKALNDEGKTPVQTALDHNLRDIVVVLFDYIENN